MKDTLSDERLVPALPGALADPTANAAVIPLIPLCPSLLCAAEFRAGETPLGRAERGAVRDVARVGRWQRAGAGRREGGRGGTAPATDGDDDGEHIAYRWDGGKGWARGGGGRARGNGTGHGRGQRRGACRDVARVGRWRRADAGRRGGGRKGAAPATDGDDNGEHVMCDALNEDIVITIKYTTINAIMKNNIVF